MMTPNDWLLQTVLEYYKTQPDALDTVYNIANHLFTIGTTDRKLSVRVVNWFVSNYAKQHMTAYSIFRQKEKLDHPDSITTDSAPKPATIFSGSVSASPPPGYDTERFIVWNQYSSAKRGYVSKDMFDPYCRRARIAVQRPDGSLFNTTLGQLNFFKWAIQNRIIDYIVVYYDDIVRDMGARLTAKTTRILAEEEGGDRPTTERRPRKKREELSVSACRSIKTITIKSVDGEPSSVVLTET